MPNWALPLFSWVVSFYFLFGFVTNVGFPPDRSLFLGDALYVALWLLFLFLPFYSKIKIGSVLELEREVTKTKEELRDFKQEIRNSLSVLSTNVNTIGGLSNQVTVNIPGVEELRESRNAIAENAPQVAPEAAKIGAQIRAQSEDMTLAVAKTRIEIERLLRSIVGKRLGLAPAKRDVQYASLRQLFERFVAQHPQYEYLTTAFLDVVRVGNAVIHAQRVSEEQAKEALAVGAQIIAILENVAQNASPAG